MLYMSKAVLNQKIGSLFFYFLFLQTLELAEIIFTFKPHHSKLEAICHERRRRRQHNVGQLALFPPPF